MDMASFFEIVYTAPISFYSIPFSVLLILVFLASFGLIAEGSFDLEVVDISEGLKLLLAHFHISRTPILIFLFFYSMYGTLSLVFIRELFDIDILTNVIAVLNIYFCAKLAGISCRPLNKFVFVEEKKTSYIGLTAEVSSAYVTSNGGFVNCYTEDSEHQIDVYLEGDAVINKGEKVLILRKDESRYLVERIS